MVDTVDAFGSASRPERWILPCVVPRLFCLGFRAQGLGFRVQYVMPKLFGPQVFFGEFSLLQLASRFFLFNITTLFPVMTRGPGKDAGEAS